MQDIKSLYVFIKNPFQTLKTIKMNRNLFIITLVILVSCNNKKLNDVKDQEVDTLERKMKINQVEDIRERLKNHFEKYKIKPSIEINNTEGNQTEIQLGNHKIKWFNTDDETKIKVDNDLFTLKDKVTLNIVNNIKDTVDNIKDTVDFSNNWDEIKLFKYNDQEYIGIRMSFSPCTGLGCSVDYYLIYDVKTKTKNFFGTFYTDNQLELFDFSNDDKVDYISKTFIGDARGLAPVEFIYELYSIDEKGLFKAQKDSSGITYQIKHLTYPNKAEKVDKLTEHWITKIK